MSQGTSAIYESGPKTAMPNMREETDSLGVVLVPADKLWGAQTQRSLEHFNIGHDLIPMEMITSYAILKKQQERLSGFVVGCVVDSAAASYIGNWA
jgi:fumarate hydratase class II